jgi:MoCo/4Fe-4S cofactor protein with predicted Tat translocation signal
MSDHRSKIEDEMGQTASDGPSAGFIPLAALSPDLDRQPPSADHHFRSSKSAIAGQGASQPFDLAGDRRPAVIRERLAGTRGRRYWQSLEELADTEEFREYLEREFPHQAPRDWEPLSRRGFLKVMGASLALAGVGGCAWQPAEKIVPYVEQPEAIVPGKPLFFATAFPRNGYAMGVVAESQMGRPVKIEGNEKHPASKGATDAFAQASILGLYDPDRSQAVRYLSDPTTWDVFLGTMTTRLEAMRRNGGAGLRVLTETITSPTLVRQLRRLLARSPGAKLCQHDPVGQANVREGARLAFGEEVNPVYHFDRADRVLSLDADFLLEEPGSVRYARDFVDGRRVRAGRTRMNRLYVVESTPTITGAYADHHLPLRPSQIEPFARAVAAALSGAGGQVAPPSGASPEWVSAVAKDLQDHRGASLVIAGPQQPPSLHALAHAMNQALGNIGKTVTLTEAVEAHFGAREGTLHELIDDLKAGRVDTLVILGGNPVYTAPADLAFGDVLRQAGAQRPNGQGPATLLVHLGLYDDETGVLCHWHVPESHYLEAWSDARAYDGTASIVQPLIQPLYDSKSVHEVAAVLLGEGDRYGYDIVRDTWKGRFPAAQYEKLWYEALLSGVISGTAAAPKAVTLRPGLTAAAGSPPAAPEGLELVFRPDPTVWDGRYANNAWLQELPKPLTQLTWDNAALISPNTAKALNLRSQDLVDLSYGVRTLRAAVWVTPGHPDETVTLSLGYGRGRAGKLGTGNGFNAYALRTSEAPWFGTGLQVRKAGGSYKLANTQRYFNQFGRDLVRSGTIGEFTADPQSPAFMRGAEEGHFPSLYPQMWPSDDKSAPGVGHEPHTAPGEGERPAESHGAGAGEAAGGSPVGGVGQYPDRGYNDHPVPAWGMVIDNNACIGCNACVLACQSENNIATVGKDQVLMHRQMHWIRIDTYYAGSPENPDTLFAPIPCMHCEKAPCEPVCPVEATSHSAEGLNEQTYNRCVGTRYCQNNCPYKVRRFNFLQYSDQKTPTIQMMRNPDVTVRSRGVMEKCTYCVQRINEARIQAEKEDREIRDGAVIPACAQACPTEAIIFGNINDTTSHDRRGSEVRRIKQEPLNYAILTELNTRPRTSYLAKLRNPNPALGA